MTSYADFYRRSIDEPDAFWTEQAKLIDWQQPFTRVCNFDNPPFVHWFEGGKTNLCRNAVDRHLKDRPDQGDKNSWPTGLLNCCYTARCPARLTRRRAVVGRWTRFSSNLQQETP